jgi:hypothetical protein
MSSVLFGKKPKAIDTSPITQEMQLERQNIRGLYESMLGALQGHGAAAKERLQLGGMEEKGDIDAQLAGRGLYSTTIAPSLHGRVNERVARGEREIDEGTLDRRLGIMGGQTSFEQRFADPAFFRQAIQQAQAHNANRRRSGGLLGGFFGGAAKGAGGAFGSALGGALGGLI